MTRQGSKNSQGLLPRLLAEKNPEHLRRMLERFKRKRASFDYSGKGKNLAPQKS